MKKLIALLTTSLAIAACGGGDGQQTVSTPPCLEFELLGRCIADGKDGKDGEQGPKGDTGEIGPQGPQGPAGNDGQDAPATDYTVVEILDPCGKESAFDEVLLRMADDSILAYFAGSGGFLTLLDPGNYVTTDGTSCLFTIDNELKASWIEEKTYNVQRLYDPSAFVNATDALQATAVTLPNFLPLLNGVAGTGWLTVTLGDVNYCYQGNGANNNSVGTGFSFKGEVDATEECFSAPKLNNGLVYSDNLGQIPVSIVINGGGVSGAIRGAGTNVDVPLTVNVLK